MKSLSHNGVIVPKYEPRGFHVLFKGNMMDLTPEQEEMAVAWARKLGTEYAEDKTFRRNFFEDFSRALGVKGSPDDFDFAEIKRWVDREREAKANMPKEEKKALAAQRKVAREANKEKYGVAIIDDQKVDLGNYMTEPSGIFMGRGKHPLRGKWKHGAKESDIVLNLSPDAIIPEGFIQVSNQQWLEKFINTFSQCNSVLSCLTKLNGQRNITSANIEKLRKIQKCMLEFLKKSVHGQKLIENLGEGHGTDGWKRLETTLKDMPNSKEKGMNGQENAEKLNLESVLTTLENMKFSRNSEEDVKSAETAISEFLTSIIGFHSGEERTGSKEMTIGEILKKEKSSKYCVVIAIGLFTCLDISIKPWKNVKWYKDCMWIAKWDDSLRGKEKYVWVSDTSPMKQERERKKFDKAVELERNFSKIEQHILTSLDSNDMKTRKIATVCYLINAASMRVGDEKDEDEADTVGATTLSRDNIVIKENNIVNFNFLGKDSVKWDKDIKLPDNVIRNLREFMDQSDGFVFEGVRSEDVNAFLSEIVDGITAKVFRTYHATKAVRESLEKNEVKKTDTEAYKKYVATMANLQAAVVCNHKRKLPATWKQTLEKKKERLSELKEKAKEKKTEKSKEAVKTMELRLKLMNETKDYNLNTSLKSYVDPRVFHRWATKVGFDWKKYYSKTLQKKFSWIECEE